LQQLVASLPDPHLSAKTSFQHSSASASFKPCRLLLRLCSDHPPGIQAKIQRWSTLEYRMKWKARTRTKPEEDEDEDKVSE